MHYSAGSEHMTVNHGVPGSSPGEGAKKAFVIRFYKGFLF